MVKRGIKREWDVASTSFGGESLSELLGQLKEVAPEEGPDRAELLATIHDQIIPKLVLAHCVDPSAPLPDLCADARPPPTDDEVAAFADIAVSQDMARALLFVESVAAGGLSLEVVLLHLVAPTARLLGEEWLADRRTFSEVTIGLSTLQQMVHVLGPSLATGLAHRGFVILVSPFSEQHTLGIYLLGEFLRRVGWAVQVAPSMSESDLIATVASEHVEMVGISVSNSDLLPPLRRLVAAVKRASLNIDHAVMLGGSHPGLKKLAPEIGATYCADPRDAVRWLDRRDTFKVPSHRS